VNEDLFVIIHNVMINHNGIKIRELNKYVLFFVIDILN
jgi:hypothetical protein